MITSLRTVGSFILPATANASRTTAMEESSRINMVRYRRNSGSLTLPMRRGAHIRAAAGRFYPSGCAIDFCVCYHFMKGGQSDFTDLAVSVVQQTFDRRSLNSWIRTFQVRLHNRDRIFLPNRADDVDRFRLDFSI